MSIPDERDAQAVADAVRALGLVVSIKKSGDSSGGWSVVVESHERAMCPDFARDMIDRCEEMALPRSGSFEGW